MHKFALHTLATQMFNCRLTSLHLRRIPEDDDDDYRFLFEGEGGTGRHIGGLNEGTITELAQSIVLKNRAQPQAIGGRAKTTKAKTAHARE